MTTEHKMIRRWFRYDAMIAAKQPMWDYGIHWVARLIFMKYGTDERPW